MPWVRTDTCKQGHPWTEKNTHHYVRADGTPARRCRICKQAREQEDRARRARADYKMLATTDTLRKHEAENARVNKLLHLYDELERETRAWMRPEIEAQIAELKDE